MEKGKTVVSVSILDAQTISPSVKEYDAGRDAEWLDIRILESLGLIMTAGRNGVLPNGSRLDIEWYRASPLGRALIRCTTKR